MIEQICNTLSWDYEAFQKGTCVPWTFRRFWVATFLCKFMFQFEALELMGIDEAYQAFFQRGRALHKESQAQRDQCSAVHKILLQSGVAKSLHKATRKPKTVLECA